LSYNRPAVADEHLSVCAHFELITRLHYKVVAIFHCESIFSHRMAGETNKNRKREMEDRPAVAHLVASLTENELFLYHTSS